MSGVHSSNPATCDLMPDKITLRLDRYSNHHIGLQNL